jgi:glucose-1-phosphate thymidylyltransferase
LIPVANKPILQYGIESLHDAGIREIALVVGHAQDEIRLAIKDGSHLGVKIEYLEQKDPKGLAHALYVAKDYVGEDEVLMYLGDNVIDGGIGDFVTAYRESGADAAILLNEVKEPSHFGIAELRDGEIVRLVEKPKVPPSNLAIVGVYAFNASIFPAIQRTKPSARGELEITDAIQNLINEGKRVLPFILTRWWKDTGRPADVLDLNRRLLERMEELPLEGEICPESHIVGRVQIGKGTSVTRSVLRGPIIVGKNCHLSDCYIGPFTSIGDKVTIAETEIQYSIVMDNSEVKGIGAHIDHSLIGRNVILTRSHNKPLAHRFILADDSRAEVA